MSQIVLDDQLAANEVLAPFRRWFSVRRLQELRPTELILDDRVPELLLSLRQPTFVTIDRGFWNRRLCNPKYCVLYFALRDDQQEQLPGLLRELLRVPEFRTRRERMGKVARVSTHRVAFWQFRAPRLQYANFAK